jgi:hypothetical protein
MTWQLYPSGKEPLKPCDRKLGGTSGSAAQIENHANFYNRYLLLLEEVYIDEQASKECSNQCCGP